MNRRYQGRGVLSDDKGRRLEEVDYDFTLRLERGAIGTLYGVNRNLPKLTLLRLRLENDRHYLDVRIVLMQFDRLRKLWEYGVYMSPDQPDDKCNLLTYRLTKQKTHVDSR